MENQSTNSDQPYYVVYYDISTQSYGNPILMNSAGMQQTEKKTSENQIVKKSTINLQQEEQKKILNDNNVYEENKFLQTIHNANEGIQLIQNDNVLPENQQIQNNDMPNQNQQIQYYNNISGHPNNGPPHVQNQNMINQQPINQIPGQDQINVPTGINYKCIQSLQIDPSDLEINKWKDPISQYNYTVYQYNWICEQNGQQKLDPIYNLLGFSMWWYIMVFVNLGCCGFTPKDQLSKATFIVLFVIAWIIPYLIIGINFIILIFHVIALGYQMFAFYKVYKNKQKVNPSEFIKKFDYRDQIYENNKNWISYQQYTIDQSERQRLQVNDENWDNQNQQEAPNIVRNQIKVLLYTNHFVNMYWFISSFKCYIVYSLHLINAIFWIGIAQGTMY